MNSSNNLAMKLKQNAEARLKQYNEKLVSIVVSHILSRAEEESRIGRFETVISIPEREFESLGFSKPYCSWGYWNMYSEERADEIEIARRLREQGFRVYQGSGNNNLMRVSWNE